jgi:flagellar basal-body rod protein FlgG
MAIMALNSAATAMNAISTQIDVIANNLANAETTAFKSSRANFEELYYQKLRQPGTTTGAGEISPNGQFVGLGVRMTNTQINLEQGTMETTGKSLDVAIEGAGFFQVKTLPTVGNGLAYTRNGNLQINSNRELVIALGDGYRFDPAITVPDNINPSDISISKDGVITTTASNGTVTNIGQLKVYTFINPQGLTPLGGGLYQTTEASGPVQENLPGENGAGQILQGSLEGSNVDPTKELVMLIKAQRSFELNSQSIQTADQTLQTITNLRRG